MQTKRIEVEKTRVNVTINQVPINNPLLPPLFVLALKEQFRFEKDLLKNKMLVPKTTKGSV